eukprot:gene42568-58219_t
MARLMMLAVPEEVSTLLILAPLSTLGNWESELQKWGGFGEEILRALRNPGADLVVCDEGHILRNPKTAGWAGVGLEVCGEEVLYGT